jgi:two-component system phosphate regulon sensor histidine kinase PhoR
MRQPSEPEDKMRPAWPVAAAACFMLALMAVWSPALWPLAAVGGAVVLVVALSVDKASRTPRLAEARQARRDRAENSSTAILDALDYPAYLFDARKVLRHANSAGLRVFGQAVAGEGVSLRFRRPEIARLVDQAVAQGTKVAATYEERAPIERWFTVEITPVPQADADSGALFLLTFRDDTEARRVEQMRSDFIANASHELRTPLASLRGFIETIQGPAAGDRAATRQFLQVMLAQAERMSRLIDDLLSLSRIEMKLHQRPQDVVDLCSVLREVGESLAALAAKLEVELVLDLPAVPLPVRGDRDELFQVFENLAENALKYGQSGKRVDVTARRLEAETGQAGAIEVSVRDRGPGIAPQHLPRLTERFYRVDVESSRDKQGTGLGLAIVKHILNRHGTRLQVRSEVGKGSVFSVTFAGSA